MPLSFRQVEIIHAVARHGTVTAASAALEISQPAVSMMLRDSVAATGFPLFVRRRGRLQPTAELRLMLDELERVVLGAERINRMIEDIRETNIGSVTVAATPTLAENLLPQAIAQFRRSRPLIQIAVQTLDNIGVADAVTQQRVDLGLVLSPLPDPDARLVRFVRLCSAELVCIVPPNHALAAREVVEARDLVAYPLIGVSRGLPLGDLVDTGFRNAGLPLRLALEVTQTSVALGLVRAGAGVAIVDPFLGMDNRDHGVVALRLQPGIWISAEAMLPPKGNTARAALMLLATLRKIAMAARPHNPAKVGRPASSTRAEGRTPPGPQGDAGGKG